MKTLVIDSSSSKEILVGLQIDSRKYVLKNKTDSRKAQIVLPMIEKILKKYSIKLGSLDAVEVNTGPGSFTGLRVGISVANSLGSLLKIPINRGKIGQVVEPIYK